MKKIRLAIFAALVGCSLIAAETAPDPASAQSAKELKVVRTKSQNLQYLLFLPKGYEEGGVKKWPLIMFLHGAGERGTDVWLVAKHGPPKIVARQAADFPFIVVSPQCPDDQVWSTDILVGFLDDLQQRYAIDSTRVYLTGLSMGGYGTWDLGLSCPDRFAAIAPICGGGDTIKILLAGSRGEALKTLGVWVFHGGKDSVVPVSESERMVAALKKAGVKDLRFTVYPDAGHDSWTATYDNPEFYKWLLAHKRD